MLGSRPKTACRGSLILYTLSCLSFSPLILLFPLFFPASKLPVKSSKGIYGSAVKRPTAGRTTFSATSHVAWALNAPKIAAEPWIYSMLPCNCLVTSMRLLFTFHFTHTPRYYKTLYEQKLCTDLLSHSECSSSSSSWRWWWWWCCCCCYSPSVNIEWSRRDNSPLSSSSSVVDYGRRLILTTVTPSDSGQYVCRASNKIGDATATVLLTVDGMCCGSVISALVIDQSINQSINCLMIITLTSRNRTTRLWIDTCDSSKNLAPHRLKFSYPPYT